MKFNFRYFLDIFLLLEGVDVCSLVETGKILSNIVGTGVYHICLIRCVALIKHLITWNALQWCALEIKWSFVLFFYLNMHV